MSSLAVAQPPLPIAEHSARRAAAVLERAAPHPVGARRALDLSFSVRTSHPEMSHYFADLVAGFPPAGDGAACSYAIVERPRHRRRWQVWIDAERTLRTREPWHAVGVVLSDVVSRSVRTARAGIVLHAAAAAWRGRAVVIPGPSGSGKSTLVTALVEHGFDYLTDEAVAFDRGSDRVRALPKPIAIELPSQEVYPHLAPVFADDGLRGREWLVPPGRIRPGCARHEGRAGGFVLARFDPVAELAVRRLGASEAVVALAGNAFGFGRDPAAELRLLADLVGRMPVFELVYGRRTPSVAGTIVDLMDEMP